MGRKNTKQSSNCFHCNSGSQYRYRNIGNSLHNTFFFIKRLSVFFIPFSKQNCIIYSGTQLDGTDNKICQILMSLMCRIQEMRWMRWCLLFTWECVLRLFSKCIAGFSCSFCCHGVSGLKQGSCRCDWTHQYPSCSAVNIYQAFSTNRWFHKCFGWSFYGKFKVWWPAYGKANKHEQSDYKQRKLIFALFLSENSNSILESLLSIM